MVEHDREFGRRRAFFDGTCAVGAPKTLHGHNERPAGSVRHYFQFGDRPFYDPPDLVRIKVHRECPLRASEPLVIRFGPPEQGEGADVRPAVFGAIGLVFQDEAGDPSSNFVIEHLC